MWSIRNYFISTVTRIYFNNRNVSIICLVTGGLCEKGRQPGTSNLHMIRVTKDDREKKCSSWQAISNEMKIFQLSKASRHRGGVDQQRELLAAWSIRSLRTLTSVSYEIESYRAKHSTFDNCKITVAPVIANDSVGIRFSTVFHRCECVTQCGHRRYFGGVMICDMPSLAATFWFSR